MKRLCWFTLCFLCLIICCGANGFSYFGSEDSSGDLVSFSNISSEIQHPMFKRDAYETLRELSGNTDDTEKQPPIFERRLYNSSVALTIPFFSFKIPHLLNGGFLVNQALFGVFCWVIIAISFGTSFLFSGTEPTADGSRNMKRIANAARTSNFNFMGTSFSKSFGMDGLECLQKVICQCNRPQEYKRYGIIARSIQNLIPAPLNATLETEASPFQSAARLGKYSKEDCDQNYDCILDPLGSARFLAHWYGQNHGGARALLKIMDFYSDTPFNLHPNSTMQPLM